MIIFSRKYTIFLKLKLINNKISKPYKLSMKNIQLNYKKTLLTKWLICRDW